MIINSGGSTTPSFYVYGVSPGTVTYTANAGSIPIATGSVTVANSGFVLVTPFGTGANFPATANSSTAITVQTAVLDSGGNYAGTQAIAGGITASVNVTSGTTSVGTISGSPAVITSTNNSASVQFNAGSSGSTLLSAVSPGAPYTTPTAGATATATVSQPSLRILTGNNSVGKNLELSGLVTISSAAPASGVTVTLSVVGSALLSATGTDAGSSQISVTIPANSTSGTFYIYGEDLQGTATVSASASGYTSFSQPESLTPSGVIILGPFYQNGSDPWFLSLSGGSQTFSVMTAQIDTSGNYIQTEPLAGNTPLSVTLNNSDSTVGTVPASVSISPGYSANGTATALYQPLKTGSNTITAVTPNGFSSLTDGTNMLTVIVQ